MQGKRIAVGLRKGCSMSGLEEVSRHKYLEHGEVLVEGVAKLLGDHCCYSAAGGAVGDSAADSAGLVDVAVGGQ